MLLLSEADIRELGVRNGAHRARLVSSLVMLRETQQRHGKAHCFNIPAAIVICTNYLRQVNEVNGGDNMFVRCVSVCLSVCVCARSGPVNQTSLKWELNAIAPKRLELRTSNLTSVFAGTVRT